MDSQEANTKGILKHPAGYTHPNRHYRSKSKDKLHNGKMPASVHSKNKISSKVPRVVRSPSNQCSTKASADKIAEKLDNSGDNKAGTSKTIQFLSKRDIVERSRPSHIPRRKVLIKENPTREKPTSTNPKRKGQQIYIERNVQRVQMLINQDYLPEEHGRVESIARPIPNLGRIYNRANDMNSGNISDWFVALNVPANSLASNVLNLTCRHIDGGRDIVSNHVGRSRLPDATVNSVLESSIPPHNYYLPMPTDQNNSDWTLSDVEYPTRDNESGYRSLSPAPHTPHGAKSDLVSDLKETTSERIDHLIRRATTLNETPEKDSPVSEQPTVVLAKITSSVLLKGRSQKSGGHTPKPDVHSQVKKSHHSMSSAVHKTNQKPVPSYVDCPSEVLQKTTNFEGDCCVTTPNSVSSITGTDLEIRDDMSSQSTLDPDECSMCDQSAVEWCNKCGKPQVVESRKELFSETTSIADSMLAYLNDDLYSEVEDSTVKESVYNLKPFDDNYGFWKKHNINRDYCEKCQRYRRFPSSRYKELKTFSSIRRRISIRICRRRLSRVWKKTTERWAMWSAKPPQRFKKHRMMRYLQRSIVSEDAHAQTNVFVYRETGTSSAPRERKSQAITALLNMDSSFSSYRSETGTNATLSPQSKNKRRNNNLGPSMFPLFYNTDKNAIFKQNIRLNPIPDTLKKQKIPSKNKDTQKADNSNGIQSSNSLLDKQPSIQEKPQEQSEDSIHICEITVDDKDTCTEDMLPQLKEQVTSTLLHLDAIRMFTVPTQNVDTQMWLVCSDAETNVTYPCRFLLDRRSTAVSTNNNNNFALLKPVGINTEPKSFGSMKIMTSPSIMKTHNATNTEAQVDEMPPETKKLPTGIATCTSSHLFHNPLDKEQVMLIPFTPMRTIAATTSKKEFIDAGLMVFHQNLNSGNCITPPSLQVCQCPLGAPCISCGTGTDTNDVTKNTSNSSAKLKTYVNTGILINTIVEQAVLRGSPKFSIFTDTKSIGNKYKSDVGVCTNTTLKDSVIETEKGPQIFSVNTNTFMSQESKFTEQNSSFATEDSQRIENGTQYSDDENKADTEAVLRLCEGIGQSHLMSIRTLNRSVEDMGAQTDIAFIENGANEVLEQKKGSSTVSTSCSFENPPKPLSVPTDNTATKDSLPRHHLPSSMSPSCSFNEPPKLLSTTTDNTNRKDCKTNIDQKPQPMSPNAKKSNSNVDSSRQMNDAVLSSALDAVKWIKAGFQAEMERANKGNSTNPPNNLNVENIIPYIDQLSKISGLQSNALNVVTQDYVAVQDEAGPTNRISNNSKDIEGKTDSKLLCSILKTLAETEETVETNTVNQQQNISVPPEAKQTLVQMIDEVTSDVLVKDVKEITLQASPESCDAATEYVRENQRKSASVLTSRCILPGLPYYHCENHRCGELSGDCRFVYDLPHCVVHTRKPEDNPVKTEHNSSSLQGTQRVQTLGVTTNTSDFQTNWSMDQKLDNDFDSILAQESIAQENELIKSKCCCHPGRAVLQSQANNPVVELSMRARNTIDPLSRLIKLSSCCEPKTTNKQSNRPVCNTTSSTISGKAKKILEQPGRIVEFAPSCNQPKQSTLQQISDHEVVSTNTSTIGEMVPQTVGTVTSYSQTRPSVEQQTSHITRQDAGIEDTTSTNEHHFSCDIGCVTSLCVTKPTTHKQTSHVIVNHASDTTSVVEDKQSVGLNTSRIEKPVMVQKQTSNIYQTACAKTSVKDPLDRSVGVITSRQNSPPLHDKRCSNITRYATATTSMHDEMNTQSIGVVNSNFEDDLTLTSSHPVEQCVQSIGMITTAWKGTPVVRDSDVNFLLSPKEYEALYKTTRLLTKEAAKAAVKEESLGFSPNFSQVDAAVEVLLRAEMRSAENMTTPAMQSETVMATPMQHSGGHTIRIPSPEQSAVAGTCTDSRNKEQITRPQVLDSASSSYGGCHPSCSDQYPLLSLEIPTRDIETVDDKVNMKTQLAASCRYYSSLLTKHLDSVKENFTKHLSESPNNSCLPTYTEACTMKPSAREEFGCQTIKDHAKEKSVLDPATNEIDICRHDKEHLQSVYYMLSAIEGRLRRLKSNVDNNS